MSSCAAPVQGPLGAFGWIRQNEEKWLRVKGLDEAPYLVFRFVGGRHRLSDLPEELGLKAASKAMYGCLHRPLGHGETLPRFGVAARRRRSQQALAQRVEERLTPLLAPLLPKGRKDLLDHGKRPTPFVEHFGRHRLYGLASVSILGVVEGQFAQVGAAASLQRLTMCEVVGQKVLHRGEQESPKTTPILGHAPKIPTLEQREEECLHQVPGIISRSSATANVGVQGIPVGVVE